MYKNLGLMSFDEQDENKTIIGLKSTGRGKMIGSYRMKIRL